MTTTRSRLIATLFGLVALTLGMLAAPTAPALASTPKPILYYTGNGGWPASLFASFAQATGRPKQALTVLPADLSAYTCVVLPLNSIPFDAAQQDALASYVKGGGRVLALGENLLNGEVNTALSDLAAAMGTSLAVVPAGIDGYDDSYPVTTDIDRSAFTADVEGLYYASTSRVAVGDAGWSLARTRTGGATFLAAERVGRGFFFLSGDSNAFTNFPAEGWSTPRHNGQLAANLCGFRPNVGADQAAVTVVEGGLATNSGIVSDPDGDAVTLSASLGTVVDNGDGSWSWSHATPDGPMPSETVTITADDGAGNTGQTTFVLAVGNGAPTITGLVVSGSGLAGQPLVVTGTATDPSSADTAGGFTWEWAVDGGAYAPGPNPLEASVAGCGVHTVSARARDKDGGLSAPVSVTVTSFEGRFLAPLTAGSYNTVQAGRVIPVKVTVGCGGAAQTGLAPAIQLLKGDASAGEESGTTPVETASASAADTTGVMRAVEGGYLYNLQVPANAKPGDLYTIRVRPFGDAQPGASITVVLAIK